MARGGALPVHAPGPTAFVPIPRAVTARTATVSIAGAAAATATAFLFIASAAATPDSHCDHLWRWRSSAPASTANHISGTSVTAPAGSRRASHPTVSTAGDDASASGTGQAVAAA